MIAGPGILLGESALLAETTRPTTATAREPAAVLRISRTMFRKMLEGYPEAAHRLRDVIAARADQWARDMENVRDALAPRNSSDNCRTCYTSSMVVTGTWSDGRRALRYSLATLTAETRSASLFDVQM
jgi:CRP-like cAMP-binding protein